MREIKFRAWDKENKRFGYLDHPFDNNWYVTPTVFGNSLIAFPNNWKNKKKDNYILMQFTGLYDKNGKEIYEGDICSTDLSRPYLIVVFRNGAFMYQCHDDGKDYFDIMLPNEVKSDADKYTEVIGNIYENPELLEVTP